MTGNGSSSNGNNGPIGSREKQIPPKLTPLHPETCLCEGCKKKISRASFCEEHYIWFKEGLITIDGYKAKDFDKKYQGWLRRSQKVA